ncbi:MAG: phosphatidylserine decarboxylase [Parachlamydiaceae bacterium]|nr:phosphatidylserine decarboxylase [Parachlamydiaceae bacterium]
MDPITYIDRKTGKVEQEQVYGAKALNLLYGKGWLTTFFGGPIAHLCARLPFFSAFFGYLKTRPSSVNQIAPFIKNFKIDTSEFQDHQQSFTTFNDFFIRKLKPSARPIAVDKDLAIIPADGRYWFYQHYNLAEGIIVKGERFDLKTLLDNKELANEYSEGAMVIARLCPTDYHRFHFPCDCLPGETKLINGWLYSVNPMAIKKDLQIFTQNKRTLCELETKKFGKVLFLEVGATFVGAIHQTYTPQKPCAKGDEKGYFSFGASSLILLFKPNTIIFDTDLVEATKNHLEIRCLMGQSMGKC